MNPDISLWLAATAGVLSFISPCVLPLVPAYLGYLSGTMVTATGVQVIDRRATFLHALSFVLGFAVVYTLLGASVGLVGYILIDQLPLIQKAGGIVLALFGLHTMGVIQVPFLYREFKMEMGPRRDFGYLSSALVGLIFAVGWTPCVGVILSGILLMAYSSTTVGQGALLLLVYALGLGIPFLVVGAALDRMTPVLRRINQNQRTIAIVSGLLLILMGVLIFFNFFQYLAAISAPAWRNIEGLLGIR